MAAAVPSLSIAPPSELPKKGNLLDNWRQWKQNFDIFLSAAGISSSDEKACPLFLYSIGQHGRNIFNDLQITEPHNLEEFYAKFDEHCNPKRNLTFERYTFFNTKQQNKQSFDQFYQSLKQISLNCEFSDLTNSLIGTQIIIGISNTALRKQLLTIPDLTLNDIVEACKSSEAAQLQADKMKSITSINTSAKKQQTKSPKVDTDSVEKLTQKLADCRGAESNQVKKEKPTIISNCKYCSSTHKYGQCPSKPKPESSVSGCSFCGKSHNKQKCPAFGVVCHKCKKPNHFANMCKTGTAVQ